MESEKLKNKYSDVGEYLSQYFNSRRLKNKKYSLRAFARDLSISPGRASEFLSGKSIPGQLLRKRIANALQLNVIQVNKLNLLVENHIKIRKGGNANNEYLMTEKDFALLPDWRHFAVLNLLNTSNFKSDIHWMAKRLDISSSLVEDSLKNLCAAKLVVEIDGTYKATHQNLVSATNIPSSALRSYNRQIIEKSLWCLDNVPLELREISSIMVTANPNNLYKLKLLVKEFKQKATEFFNEGDTTEIYNICIQIFPSTIIESNES